MHVSPPSEKIPSPAARSGYTPVSVIFCGWAHGSPVPYQSVIVAYTEFTFRSPSGSDTCAKTKKPSPDWTGSIAVDGRGDVGDPDDDRGEQDDRHREDQDRADDFGDP